MGLKVRNLSGTNPPQPAPGADICSRLPCMGRNLEVPGLLSRTHIMGAWSDHYTHTHTHTHTSSHETRGNKRVVLPPANPPSLLLTAPPRFPLLQDPVTNTSASLWHACFCVSQRALCARRKTHSCAAEPSSYVCIVIHTYTHTHTSLTSAAAGA